MKASLVLNAALLLGLIVLPGALCAQSRDGWDFTERIGMTAAFPGFTGRGTPAFVSGAASSSVSFTAPVLRSPGIMHDSNFLGTDLTATVSQDTLGLSLDFTLQPHYLVRIFGGASVGTGWPLSIGPTRMRGLAINPSDDTLPIRDLAMGEGFVYRARLGAEGRFLGEALSGDPWERMGFLVTPVVSYRALSAARNLEAWVYQDDAGMNFNGFTWGVTGSVVMFMPVYSGLKELQGGAEFESWLPCTDVFVSSPAGSGGWGSDQYTVEFFASFAWLFNPWSRLDVKLSLDIQRAWTADSMRHRYFGNRTYEGADPRLGLSVGYVHNL